MKVKRNSVQIQRFVQSSEIPGKIQRRPEMLYLAGCIALLLALNIATFWDHWRAATSFTFDFPMGYYAGTAYWITAVQSGEWPHWIPYEAMGAPASLTPQLGLFYLPFWLLVLLRIPYTLHVANIVQVLHVWFGVPSAFCFSRYRLFRSTVVALCGAACFSLYGGFFTNVEIPISSADLLGLLGSSTACCWTGIFANSVSKAGCWRPV